MPILFQSVENPADATLLQPGELFIPALDLACTKDTLKTVGIIIDYLPAGLIGDKFLLSITTRGTEVRFVCGANLPAPVVIIDCIPYTVTYVP